MSQKIVNELKKVQKAFSCNNSSPKIKHETLCNESNAGADPEILKRGGALCRPPWLADEESFRFQMV